MELWITTGKISLFIIQIETLQNRQAFQVKNILAKYLEECINIWRLQVRDCLEIQKIHLRFVK